MDEKISITRTLVLDLNGVLVKGPYITKRLMEDFGIAEEDALATFKKVMAVVRLPDAPEVYSLWEPHFKRWGMNMDKKQWYAYFFPADNLVDEMVAVAQQAKEKGIKVIILSNNFRERTAYYDETFPVLRTLADKIYYSWQTGFVKPSKEALQLVLKDFPYPPEEFLYFDDGEENVSLAKELGIQAYFFKSSADVAEKLDL